MVENVHVINADILIYDPRLY